MTEKQIELVRESWRKVVTKSDAAAAEFYVALFAESPHLLPVFAGPDMEAQGVRLIRAVDRVINCLDQIAQVLPLVKRFARRYARAAAEPAHTDVAFRALLEMLRSCLGDDFTDEHHVAWETVYDELAGVAQAAAWEVFDA